MRANRTNEKLDLFHDFQSGQIERRQFLKRLAVLSGFSLLPINACKSQKTEYNPSLFTKRDWEILTAVQEHLFPQTDDSPGASDLSANIYLQENIILDKNGNQEELTFIIAGPGRLESVSHTELGKSFLKLSFGEKENILQFINEYLWGERWLSLLLLYIFEALLADPLYGGNPDGKGWDWLDHHPGYPRPNQEQIYRINRHGA